MHKKLILILSCVCLFAFESVALGSITKYVPRSTQLSKDSRRNTSVAIVSSSSGDKSPRFRDNIKSLQSIFHYTNETQSKLQHSPDERGRSRSEDWNSSQPNELPPVKFRGSEGLDTDLKTKRYGSGESHLELWLWFLKQTDWSALCTFWDGKKLFCIHEGSPEKRKASRKQGPF